MRSPLSILPVSLLILMAGTSLRAQSQPRSRMPQSNQVMRLTEVEFEEIDSPQYDVSVRIQSPSSTTREEWLQVVVEFDTAPEWLDEATFTFYVVLKGDPEDLPEGSKPVNLFSGTATLVNIPKDRGYRLDMFLDPDTFERYGEVTHIAVLAEVDGAPGTLGLVQPASSEASEWWRGETPNAIPLRPRHETPFAFVQVERQGTVKR